MIRRAAMICALIAPAACSGTSSHDAKDAPTTLFANTTKQGLGAVAHAMVVAQAIKTSHIGCDDPTQEPVPRAGTAVNPVTEHVTCDIDDDSVVITLFRDHQSMVSLGLPYVHQATCYMQGHQSPNTFSPPNLTYVEGENWIVFPENESTAEKVATVVGGSLRTDTC